MKQWQAESLLFFITLIWGATFLFTKIGIEHSSFSLYIALRFFIALLCALVFFGKHLKRLTKRTLKGGLILGLFLGSGFVLQTFGLKFTDVSNSAFITSLTVPITPFIVYILIKSKIKKTSILGVVVAFIGLTIFTNPFASKFNIGDIITLLSAACWAFYITYMDIYTKETQKHDIYNILTLQLGVSLIMSLIVFFTFEFREPVFHLNQSLIISLLFNGVLASFLDTFIHTASQKYTTPVKAALIFSLEPIFATIYSIIFFAEVLNTFKIVGGTIMLSGILISELGPMLMKNKNLIKP